MSIVSVVCCQIEVSETGSSLVQRSPTECDCEATIMRRPWPTTGCVARGGGGGRYVTEQFLETV
jgi:hypothetical protein